MATINRVPKGWLGTLDAKTLGRTPSDPLGKLTPSFDMTPNYLADIPISATAASQVAGSGQIGTNVAVVTVPDGELWYVYGVSGEAVSGAAGGNLKQQFGIVYVAPTGLGAHWINVDPANQAQGAGINQPWVQFESFVVAKFFTTPFLAPSGAQFAVRQTRLWTNNCTTTTSVLHRTVVV